MEIRIAEIEATVPSMNGMTDNSGVAVTTEVGGSSAWGYDHPVNKNLISKRLALQVVHGTYGIQGRMTATENNVTLYSSLWTGPVLSSTSSSSSSSSSSSVIIELETFTSTNLTLHDVKGVNSDGTRDDCTLCCDRLPPFEVSSDHSNWTRVSRENIILHSSSVELQGITNTVRFVRYGWSDFQDCVLVNNDSLPLAPFVRAVTPTGSIKVSSSSSSSSHMISKTTTTTTTSTTSTPPPMGFNSWNAFHCNIDENMVKSIADSMVSSGLAALGYEYINIDDCWMVSPRSSDGRIIVDPVKFPSGMKHLANYVHSKGLKFGLYTAQAEMTCQDREGSFEYELVDAETYCDWGLDYLKVDSCHGDRHKFVNTSWALFRQGFDACFERTGRYTTMSVESCGDPKACGSWIGKTANLWRTGNDVQAYFDSIMLNIHQNNRMASVVNQGIKNEHGNFNDPDMLEVGNPGLSFLEQRSMMSLWAISGAPLLIGTSVTDISNETLSILGNKKVIAIDQDPGANGYQQGTLVQQGTGWEIWAKSLSSKDRAVAVAIVNLGMSSTIITANFTSWGWNASTKASAENLWVNEKESTFWVGSITSTLESHETSMFRLVPE
jgi:alpha-galactosidase